MIDYKFIAALISTIGSFLLFFPYIINIFKNKTKPHVYTWFIWVVTQGTATVAMIRGGAGIGALGFGVGTVMVFVVFLLALRNGTKNITIIDTAMFLLAAVGVVVWWLSRDPLLAVIMATGTDLLGYGPSLRKSFYAPWSETVVTWVGFVVANGFAVAALREYNTLTLTYILCITTANAVIAALCLWRRRSIPEPVVHQVQ